MVTYSLSTTIKICVTLSLSETSKAAGSYNCCDCRLKTRTHFLRGKFPQTSLQGLAVLGQLLDKHPSSLPVHKLYGVPGVKLHGVIGRVEVNVRFLRQILCKFAQPLPNKVEADGAAQYILPGRYAFLQMLKQALFWYRAVEVELAAGVSENRERTHSPAMQIWSTLVGRVRASLKTLKDAIATCLTVRNLHMGETNISRSIKLAKIGMGAT